MLLSTKEKWREKKVCYLQGCRLMIDEEVSTAALRNVERPWKGVVITFTGVEQKVSFRLRRVGLMIDPISWSCR
jgi:hypothetical protein